MSSASSSPSEQVDAAKARRSLRNGFITLILVGALVLGLLVYILAVVLDHADGEVARLTLTESAFGEWLDAVVDTVVHTTLALTLGVAATPAACS